jgi:hypothetical protein
MEHNIADDRQGVTSGLAADRRLADHDNIGKAALGDQGFNDAAIETTPVPFDILVSQPRFDRLAGELVLIVNGVDDRSEAEHAAVGINDVRLDRRHLDTGDMAMVQACKVDGNLHPIVLPGIVVDVQHDGLHAHRSSSCRQIRHADDIMQRGRGVFKGRYGGQPRAAAMIGPPAPDWTSIADASPGRVAAGSANPALPPDQCPMWMNSRTILRCGRVLPLFSSALTGTSTARGSWRTNQTAAGFLPAPATSTAERPSLSDGSPLPRSLRAISACNGAACVRVMLARPLMTTCGVNTWALPKPRA